MSAPTIDPAVLTDTVAAHRMAELIDLYFQHNQPGRYQTDAADELQALAAAVRARTGWGGAEDEDLHGCHPEFAVRPGHTVTDIDLLDGTDDEWAKALGAAA